MKNKSQLYNPLLIAYALIRAETLGTCKKGPLNRGVHVREVKNAPLFVVSTKGKCPLKGGVN